MAKDDIEPGDVEESIDVDEEDLELLEELEDEDLIDADADLDDELEEGDEAIDEEEADESIPAAVARKGRDDEDDEDDLVAPDDVEEDLAEILQDRLASEDEPVEEDEPAEWDDRASGEEALQPKRADEVLCDSCFLLVRTGAPGCPVGDDACPVFVR